MEQTKVSKPTFRMSSAGRCPKIKVYEIMLKNGRLLKSISGKANTSQGEVELKATAFSFSKAWQHFFQMIVAIEGIGRFVDVNMAEVKLEQ